MTVQELEQCVLLYGRDIYSFCLQLTCDTHLADDLYQDTFLRAMEQLCKLDRTGNVKSYLLSVALRVWKNQKRKIAWRQRIAPTEAFYEELLRLEADQPNGMESVLSNEEKTVVRRAVLQLEEKYRVPVLLFYLEEMPVREIAKLLHVPRGTVLSRLHYARKKLEQRLEGYFL